MNISRGFWKLTLGLTLLIIAFPSCAEDDPTSKSQEILVQGSQDYKWIDLELSNFPGGSYIALRELYWDSRELTADPQGEVIKLSETVFRIQFAGLGVDSFAIGNARILLAVYDSVVDELQGIVVLCSEDGPIILSPECQGDCAPLCGLPGHGCDE